MEDLSLTALSHTSSSAVYLRPMTSEVSIRSVSPHQSGSIELDVIGSTSAPDQGSEQIAPSMAGSSMGESESGVYASELPPVDRGRHAWGCLVGASLFEGMILGKVFFSLLKHL